MLLTEEVALVFSFKDVDYYESKGYKIPRRIDSKGRLSIPRGTEIIVKTKDLTEGSHAKVQVKCDYCDTVKEVEYRDYLKYHDKKLGDCCVKCRKIKHEQTMLERFGVRNAASIPNIREKIKASNRQKYGCDWAMQTSEVQAKSRQTMKEKYGVEHALQVPEFYKKVLSTKFQNGTNPTSKPQFAVYEILLKNYGNCKLEVPCGNCSLDCVVDIEGTKIDVEYDGMFWHQDKQRDIRRNNFVQSQGYKVLRIKGAKKDPIPTFEQIDEQINKLLNGYKYAEIVM